MRSRSYGGRRVRSAGPARQWASVTSEFVATSVTATGTATLISLQAPASLASLTTDPPEDMTLLRIRGEYFITTSAASNWTLALTVQDTTWTPSSTSQADGDKRLLWQKTFASGSVAVNCYPDYMVWDTGGTPQVAGVPGLCSLDITPKVKVETGKALYLVYYEDGGASTMSLAALNMRVLFQRSQRVRR